MNNKRGNRLLARIMCIFMIMGGLNYSAISPVYAEDPPIHLMINQGESYSMVVDEDDSADLTLDASGPNMDNLSWSVLYGADHGDISLGTPNTATQSLIYTPDTNYNGPDTFVIQVTDSVDTDTIIVNVTVSPVNDPPVNHAIPTISGSAERGSVLTAAHGTWDDSKDLSPGDITYSYQWQRASDDEALALGDWMNIDSAASETYTITADDDGKYIRVTVTATDDGEGLPEQQSITAESDSIQVVPNHPPVISEGERHQFTIEEDSDDYQFTLNASDGNNDSINWTIITPANQGTAQVDAQSTGNSQIIHYRPHANYSGPDSFVVQASDGHGGTDTIAVQVTVSPLNDDPIITQGQSVNVTMDEDGSPAPFGLNLEATDADEGDELTWSVKTQAGSGFANISEATSTQAAISYHPAPNYNGSDSFEISVKDSQNREDTILVNVSIMPINDAPRNLEKPGISGTLLRGSTLTAADGSWNDALDLQPGDLSFSYQWQRAEENSESSFIDIPGAVGKTYTIGVQDQSRYLRVKVIAADNGEGLPLTQSSAVSSDPVYVGANNAPAITEGTSITVSMSEDAYPVPFALTLHASDLESDALAWTISSSASNGNAAISGGSSGTSAAITYIPGLNFNGTDSFQVEARDSFGGASTITVNVTVNPVNDAPVISEGSSIVASMDEDSSSNAFSLVLNAIDHDAGTTLTWSIKNNAAHGAAEVSNPPNGPSQAVNYIPNLNYNGSDSFVVQVSDGVTSAAITVTVNISAVNDAPSFEKGGDITVNEDSGTFSLTGWASSIIPGAINESGQSLSFVVTNDNMELFSVQPQLNSDGTLSFSPAASKSGSAVVTVTLKDNGGTALNGSDTSLAETFLITVSPVNDAPSFIKGENQSLTEDDGPQSLAGWATAISRGPADEQDQTLEFIVSNSNNSLFAEQPAINSDGTLSYTLAPNANGIALVTVTAKDFGGALSAQEAFSAPQTFTITIAPVNDSPTMSAIQNQSDIEDAPSPKLVAFTVDDVDNTVSLLSITASSSNQELLPDSSIILSGTDKNRSLSLKPVENMFGSTVVTVTVSDGTLSVVRTFTLTIDSVNDLPTITGIANQTINEDGSTGNILFTIGDIETEASALSVSAIASNQTLFSNALTVGGSGENRSINLSPAANLSGTSTITVTVEDQDGGTRSVSFNITVNSTNDLPTLTVPSNITINEDCATEVLSISIGDVETPAENLSVSAVSSNTWLVPDSNIVLDGAGGLRTIRMSPVSDRNGSTNITVTVTDSHGGITKKSFRLTVTPVNDGPHITVPSPSAIDEDIVLSDPIGFTVSDIDNNAAELNVTASSSNKALIPDENIILGGAGANRTIRFIPAEDKFGSTTITLTVSDGKLHETDSFTLTVNNINDIPHLGRIANQVIGMDSETTDIPFQVWDIDNDADTLSLTASAIVSNGMTSEPGILLGGSGQNRTIKVTPAAGQTGTIQVTVYLNDNCGGIVQQTFRVEVTGTGGYSAISHILDQTIDEDTSTGNIYFSVDSIYSSVEITVDDSSIVSAGGIELVKGSENERTTYMTRLTPEPNANGMVVVTITARQSEESVISRTFKLYVNPVNDLPVITGDPFIQMDEDGEMQANNTITISDVDLGQTLQVSAISTNRVLFPDTNVQLTGGGISQTLTIKPAPDRNGTSVITVTVSDGYETVKKNFTVEVTSINDSPTLTAILSQTIAEDNDMPAQSFTVDDVELDSGSLSVWAVSNNQSLIADSSISIAGTGSSRTISLRPSPNANSDLYGTATITVYVRDEQATTTGSFIVTVTPVNDSPYVNFIANQTILEDASTGSLSFTIGDIDTPSSELTVWATSNAPDIIPNNIDGIALSGSGTDKTIRLTPLANANGTVTITVYVRDGLLTGSRSFTLQVVPVNDAPTITVDSTVTIDEDTSTLTPVSFTIGDVETPAESLVLTVNSGNETLLPQSGIELTGSGIIWSMTLKPAPNQNGVMLVPIKVFDGETTTIKNVSFIVRPINDKPTITQVQDLNLLEDAGESTVSFTVGDIETAAGSLIVTALSSNQALIPSSKMQLGGSGANRSLKLTPLPDANGDSTITIKVFDGTDTTDMIFTVHITPVNDRPSFTKGNDQTVNEDCGEQTIPLWATGLSNGPGNESDQTLSFVVSNNNDALFSQQPDVSPDGTLTFTPSDNSNGTATVSIYVRDSGGTSNGGIEASAVQTFTIRVNAVNDAPGFTKGSDPIFNEDCGTINLTNWAAGISKGPDDEGTQALTFVTSIEAGATVSFTTTPAISANGTLTFTPQSNSFGSATLRVLLRDNGGIANDGADTSAYQTFTITVNPINDAPSFTKGSNQSFTEDCGPKSISNWAPIISISAGPANESSQNLTFYTSTTNAALFAVLPEVSANGTLTFTPASNAFGTATVSVYLKDDGGTAGGGKDTSAVQTFTITISAVNDAPVISESGPVLVEMDEDSDPRPFNLTLHASDVENSPLTWSIRTSAAHGTASVSGGSAATKAIQYIPQANYNGPDSFVVRVSDGTLTASITVNVSIDPVNDAPVISEGAIWTAAISEDGNPAAFALTLHGTDADNDTITWSILSGPADGVASLGGTHTGSSQPVNYIPNSNFNGTDGFTVMADDGNGGNDTIQINITVQSVNDLPVIQEGSSTTVTMSEDGNPSPFSLTLHGTDVETGILTWSIKTQALHGQANVSSDPTGGSQDIGYLPDANYFGSDSFVVELTDANGGKASITVHVVIESVNDLPVITEGALRNVSMDEDGNPEPFALTLHGTDIDNDSLTWSIQTEPDNGTANISLTPSGNSQVISYSPDENYFGEDSFVVRVSDGNGGFDNITLHVQVNPCNDLPLIGEGNQVTVIMSEDSDPVPFGLTLHVSDVETGILTWSIKTGFEPEHGSAEVSETPEGTSQVISYVPDPNFHGSDSFQVIVTDEEGGTDSILVAVTVEEVNDLPITTDYNYTISAGTTVRGLVIASDIDGDTLTYESTTTPSTINGTFAIDAATGLWTYASSRGYTGSQLITVEVTDGRGGKAVSELRFEIKPLTITKEYIKTTVKNQAAVDSLFVDDAQGADFGWSIGILPLHGQVSVDANGQYTYTPNHNYVGTDFFTVLATGSNGSLRLQKVRIVVNDRNLSLKGIVTDGDNSDPIQDAEVRLLDQSGKLIQSVLTDASGNYRLDGIVENAYHILVLHPHYSENRRVTQISFAKADGFGIVTENFSMAKFTISLSANPTSIKGDGIDSTLLTAVIKDRNDLPIPNVTVSFSAISGSFENNTAVTDMDGIATMNYRSADLTSLHTSVIVPVTISVNDPVRNLFGEQSIFVTFAPGFVTGIVVDNITGLPVKDAEVKVYKDFDDDGITDFSFTQITGSDGKYRIAIPRGGVEYDILITKPVTIGSSTQMVDFVQKATVGIVEGTTVASERTATGVILENRTNGTKSLVNDFTKLKLEIQDDDGHVLNGLNESVDPQTGVFHAENLQSMEDYRFVVKYTVSAGQEIIVGEVNVHLTNDGEINISQILIDPYGTITDQATGEVLEGADVTLYFADTARNRAKGNTPDTKVALPTLAHFPPADNANPQNSDINGKYAFMVFPESDYYIVTNKIGYETYRSPVISVESELVRHDIQMKKIVASGGGFPGPVVLPPVKDEGKDVSLQLLSEKMKIEEGTEFSVKIRYGNKSTETVNKAEISILLPDGLSYVYTNGGTVNGQQITWSVLNLKHGEIKELEVRLKVSELGSGEVFKEISAAITSKEKLTVPEDDASKLQLLFYSNRFAHIHKWYIAGYADGEFKPQNNLTREQTAIIFAHLLNLNIRDTGKTSVYSDVSTSYWAYKYILAVTQKGLMSGTGNGKFNPNTPITRAELATVIAKYLAISKNYSVEPLEIHFSDISDNLARNNIEELYRYHIVAGYGDGTFRPDSFITRVEAVTMINRALYRGPAVCRGDVFPDVNETNKGAGHILETFRTHEYRINGDGTESIIRFIDEVIW